MQYEPVAIFLKPLMQQTEKGLKDFRPLLGMKAMTYDWVIETKELTKSYGPHVALDSLSINVPKVQQDSLARMEPENLPSSKPF